MTPAGIEPATFRFVAQHLNHCATAIPVPPDLTLISSVFCLKCIYVFSSGFQKKTAISSLYSINLSVYITEAKSVYFAVRTGSLNATDPVRP